MLIPTSNSSNPCDAIDALEASRPNGTPEYQAFQFAWAAIMATLAIGSLPFVFWLRNEPRFYKVRPFWLSVVLSMALTLFAVSTLLAEAQVGPYPCELLLFFHSLGPTILVSMLFGRAFMLVIETQYQNKLVEEGNKPLLQDGATQVTLESEFSAKERLFGFRQAIFLALRLANGFGKVESLTLEQLTNLRRNYAGIIGCFAMPPFIVLAIGVAAFPIYRSGCVNCFIFVEFIVIVLLAPTFSMAMVGRFLLFASRLKSDEQDVLLELKTITFYAVPFSFVGYLIFMIPDPGNYYFDRVFNPQFFSAVVLNLVVWYSISFRPIFKAIMFKRERVRMAQISNLSSHNSIGSDFTLALDMDAELKREFYQFAAARYCNESLNFLEDVKRYKLEFASGKQSDKWMAARAAKLIGVYIREGATQEINISSALRGKILSKQLTVLSSEELANLFNDARTAILDMMQSGTWTDFQNARKKQQNRGGPGAGRLQIAQVEDAA